MLTLEEGHSSKEGWTKGTIWNDFKQKKQFAAATVSVPLLPAIWCVWTLHFPNTWQEEGQAECVGLASEVVQHEPDMQMDGPCYLLTV